MKSTTMLAMLCRIATIASTIPGIWELRAYANRSARKNPNRVSGVPGIGSIAMLVNPANPSYVQAETKDLQSAAHVLGVRVLVLNGGTENDIAAAFATLVEQQVSALLVSADSLFYAALHQIISLAAGYAIPTMFYNREAVAAGGLLSYGADLRDLHPQIGLDAGRILKGEKPADLPIVQPTKEDRT